MRDGLDRQHLRHRQNPRIYGELVPILRPVDTRRDPFDAVAEQLGTLDGQGFVGWDFQQPVNQRVLH